LPGRSGAIVWPESDMATTPEQRLYGRPRTDSWRLFAASAYNSATVFDIGASLAAARETRGYSLADAERLTNVRGKYLAALECGDFDALPGRTYARAFLRTYATALGLEADRFVTAFEE